MSRSIGPNLGRKYRVCVAFARFAAEHKVDAVDLAELIALAQAAFAAGEREACRPNQSADPQRTRFERKATRLGFEVDWPGLWPTLVRESREIYLPEV